MDYLSGAPPYNDRIVYPPPDIVFLDVNMPKRSGHEVLEWVRAQLQLKALPVVMLSSSISTEDVYRASKAGITSYLQKTSNFAEFEQIIKVVFDYQLGSESATP